MQARGVNLLKAAVCGLLLCGAVLGMPQVRADDGLRARYGVALRDTIQNAWLRPEGIEAGRRCRLAIRQVRGGDVVSVKTMPDCAFDATAQASLLRAVQRAAPLPYAGFEPVFDRDLTITFSSSPR